MQVRAAPGQAAVASMVSAEGEVVELVAPVKVTCSTRCHGCRMLGSSAACCTDCGRAERGTRLVPTPRCNVASMPMQVGDAIEAWLEGLADAMRATLRGRLGGVAGLADPFAQAPTQVLGLYYALSFTERCAPCRAAACGLCQQRWSLLTISRCHQRAPGQLL